jgi:hypothetical protein
MGKLSTVTRGLRAASFLFLATLMMAQVPMPRTVPLTNAQGETIGSITFSGRHIFLRDLKGEIFAQIIVAADGTQTLLDSHGKVLEQRNAK